MQFCPSNPPLNHAIELVAGQFAPDVRLIWSGARAAEYLTAPDARRHVWHACLASEYGNFSPAREDADFLYSRLTSMKAKDLIVQAYGVRPRGIIGVLRRLGPAARSPETYRMIVSVLEKGGAGARFLINKHQPDDLLIEAVAALSCQLNDHECRAWLYCDSADLHNLAFHAWTAARFAQSQKTPEFLSKGDPASGLRDALLHRPFPTPPSSGTEELRPIMSARDLRDVGRRFKNCLGRVRDAFRVVNGLKFFYEWTGSEPAVVDLVRFGGIGWYVNDTLGIQNIDVSPATRRQIALAFSNAPMICTTNLIVQNQCSALWFDIVHAAN